MDAMRRDKTRLDEGEGRMSEAEGEGGDASHVMFGVWCLIVNGGSGKGVGEGEGEEEMRH